MRLCFGFLALVTPLQALQSESWLHAAQACVLAVAFGYLVAGIKRVFVGSTRMILVQLVRLFRVIARSSETLIRLAPGHLALAIRVEDFALKFVRLRVPYVRVAELDFGQGSTSAEAARRT